MGTPGSYCMHLRCDLAGRNEQNVHRRLERKDGAERRVGCSGPQLPGFKLLCSSREGAASS